MVGSVNANDADYRSWRLDEIPLDNQYELLPKACVSSASLPGLFLPTLYEGGVYVDGGTAMGLDAISAVEKCLELVDDESKITMDIMLLDRFAIPEHELDDGDTLKNMVRMHSIKHYYKGLENVITTMLSHPNVNYRYILEPSGDYPKLWNLLNFGPENTWPMQENGMADAKAALEKGPGVGFQKYHDWIASLDEHSQSLKDFLKAYPLD